MQEVLALGQEKKEERLIFTQMRIGLIDRVDIIITAMHAGKSIGKARNAKISVMNQIDFRRPQRNFLNGQFLKGHEPYNKGKKWSEWMDMRKAKRIIRIAKQNLKPNMNLGGHNKKKVVLVTEDGRWYCFESATKAAELLNLCRRNITHCCQGKRKKCGKYRWFYFDDDQWTKLVNE